MAKIKKKSKTGPGYQGYTGKKTKLSVAAFWVRLFAAQSKAQLTDHQICSVMFGEFSQAKRYVPADVMIFRNRYNNGNLADQPDAPKVKCAEYLECTHCHKGVRKPMWGEKKPAKTVKKASRKTKASVNSGKSAKKKTAKRKATKKKG